LRLKIPHTHVCGGLGRCSTCRVLVVEGLEHCGERSSAEKVISEQLHFTPAIRLACQTQVFDNVTVRRLALDTEDLEIINDEIKGKVVPNTIDQEKHIAILFADIRGFTSFSEKVLPYDVIYVLNRYFRKMGQVISRHDGMINNYMGDGLMALFGLKNSQQAAEQAVRAAIEMLEAMEKFKPHLEMLYQQSLQIGIGIHYGSVVIGEVGASDNKRVTAIGDAVNLASRIEAANKLVGTNLVVSESIYAQVREQAIVKQSYRVQLPGKSGEYPLYEIVGISFPSLAQEIQPRVSQTSPLQSFFKIVMQFLAFTWEKLKRILGWLIQFTRHD
ncbi:MAG TPA: adenylate/guanylate cyclase domain-containing protein, partial [Coleofasciculaceae cyanobacterium]